MSQYTIVSSLMATTNTDTVNIKTIYNINMNKPKALNYSKEMFFRFFMVEVIVI